MILAPTISKPCPLAGEYAFAGRNWICARLAEILGAPIVEEVNNHHNYAWREEHNGEQSWAVRMGAHRHFQVSVDLSAVRWASSQSFSREPNSLLASAGTCVPAHNPIHDASALRRGPDDR